MSRGWSRNLRILAALVAWVPLGCNSRENESRRVEVHGHRGARAAFPENTLAAFEYALQIGVDVLEFDLAVTRDDRLAVLHDLYLNPQICLNPDGSRISRKIPVRSLSLSELQQFDCGSLPHPGFPLQKRLPGARVPSLEEVLQSVQQPHPPHAKEVGLNVETKIDPNAPGLSVPPEQFAAMVVEVLRRHGMLGRTTLQSFDPRTLRAARRLEPRIRLSVLVDENFADGLALARKIKADMISPRHTLIGPREVRQLRAKGLRVIPWTANTLKDWTPLLGLGVDGIITDDPAGLIAYLKERGLR